MFWQTMIIFCSRFSSNINEYRLAKLTDQISKYDGDGGLHVDQSGNQV